MTLTRQLGSAINIARGYKSNGGSLRLVDDANNATRRRRASKFAACADRPLHQCCNGRGLEAFVGDIPNGVRLDGVRCGGDESRACCNIPAFGQTVVATGRLVEEHETSVKERGGYWALTEVTLCTENPAVTSKPSKR